MGNMVSGTTCPSGGAYRSLRLEPAGTPYGTCHKAHGGNHCQRHEGVRGCCFAHRARGVGAKLLRFTGELPGLSCQLRRGVADQRAGCALNLAGYFLDRAFSLCRVHSDAPVESDILQAMRQHRALRHR